MSQKEDSVPWIAFLLTGASAYLALRAAALLVFLAGAAAAPVGPLGWFLISLEPLLLAAASAALLILWTRSRRQGDSRRRAAGAGFLLVLAVYLFGPFGIVARDLRAWSMLPALGLALAAGAAAWRAGSGLRTGPLFIGTFLGTAGLLCLSSPHQSARLNAYGLISAEASSVRTEPAKGEYPACTFKYNSRGYRDEEPPVLGNKSPRRILLIGDSFIFGDGIAGGEETLGRLLAAALERLAPRRYAVISAGYQGLGLYGYHRIVEALFPDLRPQAIVIGYLGEADKDPFDPQFLMERLGRYGRSRSLLIGLGTPQYVHEASVVLSRIVWGSRRNTEYFNAIRGDLSARAAERGYSLLYLNYFGAAKPPPPPAESLVLPEELRYPGAPSRLWYGHDCHPKPALNRILAEKLAETILHGERAS